jgi:5-methylcytosine-specific restriction protein A
MSTCLLTWNPARSPNDYLKSVAAKMEKGACVEDRWSCGNNQSIKIGDRVFLLRQGRDFPGIVGSGWVTKAPFPADHWDKEKNAQGLQARYVLFEWDALMPAEKALSRTRLLDGLLPNSLLKVAASGVTIDGKYVEALEKAWAAHCQTPLKVAPLVLGTLTALEGEPVEYRGYRLKRDMKLKRAALDAAKGVCMVCGVDYFKVLDGRGVRVLQVHHKSQLSQQDAPKLNTPDDLAVLCANCHALIHMDAKKALSVEALRSLLHAAPWSSPDTPLACHAS